jgi:hypothetical protein
MVIPVRRCDKIPSKSGEAPCEKEVRARVFENPEKV